MARQSLTSQMIDGVVETSKKGTLEFKVASPGGKVCPQCYAVWHNAQKFCNLCSYQFYGNWKD